MTTICEQCGSENHLEAEVCHSCGKPIQKESDYVVCAVCGLSNPDSSKKCMGCGELLNHDKSFSVELEEPKKEKKKEKIQKSSYEKWKVNFRILLTVIGLIVIVFSVYMASNLFKSTESLHGFYYITSSNSMNVVDETELFISSDFNDVEAVHVYSDQIYIYDQNNLVLFRDNTVQALVNDINSYKISKDGTRVLYTLETEDGLGDLYHYDGEAHSRIDAKVGIGRYTFGVKESVYYVTNITDEENLGDLFLKKGEDAPVKVAEDVYSPILSLEKNSVYFVRKDIDTGVKFELYYSDLDRITEIGRNLKHIIVDDKELLLIQYKNNDIKFIKNKSDQEELVESSITEYGLTTFNDIIAPVSYVDEIGLIINKNDGKSYYFSDFKSTSFDLTIENFHLSEDSKSIYHVSEDELQKSDYKAGKLSNTISVATDKELVSLSVSGQLAVLKDESMFYLYDGTSMSELQGDLSKVMFSKDEKYLIYLVAGDCFAQKLGANEPVYLGENVEEFVHLKDYVYTITNGKLFRYKLGKHGSNTELDTIQKWSQY
jgi:ribosomal protein L40E